MLITKTNFNRYTRGTLFLENNKYEVQVLLTYLDVCIMVSQNKSIEHVRYLIYNKQVLVELPNDKAKIKLPHNLNMKYLVPTKQLRAIQYFNTAIHFLVFIEAI
jgi:hypothetical protein